MTEEMTKEIDEVKEFLAKCDALAKNTTEKKMQNEKRVEEYFSQIMTWCIDKIKNSPHLEGSASFDLKILVPYYDENLELYIENCHSFSDWQGACFSTKAKYGNNRNSIPLHTFIVLHWEEIKQAIINSIIERQTAYMKKRITEYEVESDISTSLDKFVL